MTLEEQMVNLLPGQQMVNGVSSYIFGSNISEDWAQHNARNEPKIQALLKSAGLTVMRCMIVAGSPDSLIDQTIQACKNMNTAMLVILHHSDLAWNQHLVTRLGNSCNMYEFGNESDLANPSISSSQYLGFWNAHIPVLRKINTNAQFIGPVLGVFDNFDSYVIPWLQGCKGAGNLPDAVSYHIYPCTGNQWNNANCMPRASSFSSAFSHADHAIISVLGHSLPHCLTEWNIDADAKHAFDTDPSFVAQWTKTALDDMVKAGFAMACQWDAGGNAGGGVFDLVSVQNFQPNPNGQYQVMAERIAHYLGGSTPTPTPVPVPTPTPIPVPDPTSLTPLSLSYSNITSSVLSTANKLLTTNSGTPQSAQSYTTFGTQLGFVEIFAQGGMAIAATSIGVPSGRGFILDPATLNLAGQTIPSGAWSHIIRLNAAQTMAHPQAGQLTVDLYFMASKYNIVDKTYMPFVSMVKLNQAVTPNFTNYPMRAGNVSAVSFKEGETLYFEQWTNITANNNNNPQQGLRFNRLATGTIGDPFGTCVTPGYQPTIVPIPPIVTPPTVTLSDTGITPGTYTATVNFSAGSTAEALPVTLVIAS
jgi:hypothetical protein